MTAGTERRARETQRHENKHHGGVESRAWPGWVGGLSGSGECETKVEPAMKGRGGWGDGKQVVEKKRGSKKAKWASRGDAMSTEREGQSQGRCGLLGAEPVTASQGPPFQGLALRPAIVWPWQSCQPSLASEPLCQMRALSMTRCCESLPQPECSQPPSPLSLSPDSPRPAPVSHFVCCKGEILRYLDSLPSRPPLPLHQTPLLEEPLLFFFGPTATSAAH